MVEAAPFDWICDQQASRININGEIIGAKAQCLQKLTTEKLPPEARKVLNFSDGWLCNLKDRWGLRIFKSHGESGDAHVEAIARELPKIKEILKDYSPNNIFNADECRHKYYRTV